MTYDDTMQERADRRREQAQPQQEQDDRGWLPGELGVISFGGTA